ncbi:hypothetical protein NA643_15940 [Pseudomonas stutzeri]|uniref:hypothetical protein n=1 Tax=Stutzerimonas stutzeri TaxID=316 RepID=UPI000C9BDB06|nr:hypothetical protein [Stutzerimonas stutzeri]MCQ4280584.1 hypothetical protein [Stutzerimonas stutzeri]PNF72483.1 hypothetical protein CXK96_10775 [Stutzerimonas stutzeri]
MHTCNEQLAEFLNMAARSLSQLSEALTTYSFEMMASDDPAVRIASRRMVSRVAQIQSNFDHQLRLVSALTGVEHAAGGSILEVELQPSPEVDPSTGYDR